MTTVDTVISAVIQGQNGRPTFAVPNIVRLLQIYLLAPFNSTTAERSFSVQRRIRNYLRNMPDYTEMIQYLEDLRS